MKIMISRLGLLAGVVLASSSLLAQPRTEPAATDELRAYLELLRSDVNTTKIRTINEVMKLTGPEADTFWPVYRKYEKDLAAVGDRKLALIREFATLHFGGKLDNKQAADLAARWLKNTQERLDLWKKYHKQISKAVSPIRAAQFLQVEHQMALFIDLNIAAEMPAVGTSPPARK
ncbi:MAG: hypothetical protein WCL11_02550 [Verrucomicrobiota bacterium]